MDRRKVRSTKRARTDLACAVAGIVAIAAAGAAAPFYAQPRFAAWIALALVAIAALVALALWRLWRTEDDAPVPTLATATASAPFELAPEELRRQLDTLRHTQGELLLAKQAAEAAMMAKGEFLATMSHEIRTPLNGVLPLLELVLSTPLQPDQRDYLSTAHASARELLRIVDAILDYSKLDAERLELEITGLNLRELVSGVAQLMQRNAEAKGLRLTVTIDANVRLAVRGDPVRLRQVLTNLVSNAIKFTERGGVHIQVSKRAETRDHHEIVFAVRD
ncbi:MAG TPA: histidine kinase dimerization/phospho-acceptor domain-containing protein, partial [Rhodanobacteraceae bacterium]